MLNTLRIAWRQTTMHLMDPLSFIAFALLIAGQEIGWRLLYVSIDSPQSVSLSVIYGFMKMAALLVAISAGARVWQWERNDRSITLEMLGPSGVFESFFGRMGGLFLTILAYSLISAAVTWQPTMGPVAAMRPTLGLIALEQLIVGCAAAFFALRLGPLLGAFASLAAWLGLSLAPMLIGHLNSRYSPLLAPLQQLIDFVRIDRLHVIDLYAVAEAQNIQVEWSQLIGYSLSASGIFVFAGLLLFTYRRWA